MVSWVWLFQDRDVECKMRLRKSCSGSFLGSSGANSKGIVQLFPFWINIAGESNAKAVSFWGSLGANSKGIVDLFPFWIIRAGESSWGSSGANSKRRVKLFPF